MKRLLMLGSMIFAATLFIHTDVSAGALRSATVTDYTTGMAAGGIAFSRHNLGAFGRVIRTGSTTEVCIFCHTPHHSNQASGTGPLWNRAAPIGPFTAYGSTIAGSNVSTLSGPSLACLSCHDGVTTFDNLVNTPGKGGVVAGGADRVWGFNMPLYNPTPGLDQIANDGFHTGSGQSCTTCHTTASTITIGYVRSMNIGTDLSNDHPVSVAYSGGQKASLRDVNTVINSIDLSGDLSASSTIDYNGNLAQNRWSVNGFISDTAKIGDLLRGGKVECSSCHDPHFSNKSWDEVDTTYSVPPGSPNPADPFGPNLRWCGGGGAGFEDCSDGLFLRRVGGNTGSGLCRTCHEK